MGVHGLASYIYKHSDKFFEEHRLKDTQLVVDGISLASNLYASQYSKCFFGGDYDAYYEVVKSFFCRLKKCNVEVFVVIDGGMEKKKFSTIVRRCKERIVMLRNFQMKKWKNLFFPLFMSDVFKDVLVDLDIKYTTCWFEADQEIASLACFLKCPVLSCDSDYFIYGCLYIPIDKCDFEHLHFDNFTGFYMKCSIFDITMLEKHINGDRSLLPILAALQGNDYVDSKIFHNFFNHISISSSKNSRSQAKLKSVIDWLKNETHESVKVNILKHVNKKDAPKVLRAINAISDSYEIKTPTRLHQLQMESSGIDNSKIDVLTHKYLSKLPDEFVDRFNNNEIPAFVISMINIQKYIPRLQIEDVSRKSSHCISLPIISGIYDYISNLVGIQTELDVMLKMSGKFEVVPLKPYTGCLTTFDVHSFMSDPVDVRMKFIYKVLSFDESDKSLVELFDKDWKVLAISFVYWMKNASKDLSEYHFHSVVLMALMNFVQSYVGYYKNYKSFMQAKAGTLQRLSKNYVEVFEKKSKLFRDMINDITELERLTFTKKLIKLRSFSGDVTNKGYYMGTIHVMAMFQSVLYHVMKLNELLGFPSSKTYVHKIYSGTLVYNLYYYLTNRKNVTDFIRGLLKTEPNILRVYNFFVDNLSQYVPRESKRENRTRPIVTKKSRKRKN